MENIYLHNFCAHATIVLKVGKKLPRDCIYMHTESPNSSLNTTLSKHKLLFFLAVRQDKQYLIKVLAAYSIYKYDLQISFC